MELSLICGSQNKDSQSIKVTQFIANKAKEKGFIDFIWDLGTHPLPLWTSDVKDQLTEETHLLLQKVGEAQAFIVITPEWSGMATPAMKNFFLHFSASSLLSHKPALIVTVSATRGGAYPVAELRASSYKNTKLCYIPEHLIVRNAPDVLNDETPCSKEDAFIRDRINFALLLLKHYGKALVQVRSASLDFQKFPTGM